MLNSEPGLKYPLINKAFLGLLLACLGVLCLGASWATAQDVRFDAETARLRAAVSASNDLQRPAAPEYDIIALRVEFQPDTTRFTTGDGTFSGDLFGGLTPRVDPLPHEAGYFEAHLAFLEDYVARVSDGRTTLTTHLVPEVVRVSQPMGAYSPTGPDADSDEELRKLGALLEEAWRLATEQSSFDVTGFDPARTAFVLFHAGVGRDIELVGTTLDKTPQDLPSLFFDQAAFERLLGTSSLDFKGLPLQHTILMPRTETRRGTDFLQDQPFLAEFSINGLLAASFFNFLGVPDLFNTATGESAIGPFGLMDPLGLFAFNGLFPPEPSAWTKLFLGWSEPLELRSAGPEEVLLRAASLPTSNDVARAWVSGAEYFLVENRFRDPEGDGLVLQIWKDGQITEQRVANGDETFNRFNLAGFAGGVVVGVDNYDFALPGGVDEDGNALDGGILLWHIDERRLADRLPTNDVNADPARRAIDLEEADGAQDLGFPPPNPFGPAADTGSPFDFWYEGNPITVITTTGREVRLYQNRFGPDTTPSSDTNEGGPSFVVLDDFSAPATEMRFAYRQAGEGGIRPFPLGADDFEQIVEDTFVSFQHGSAVTSLAGFPLLYAEHDASAPGTFFQIFGTDPRQVFITESFGKPVLHAVGAFAFLSKMFGLEGLEYAIREGRLTSEGSFEIQERLRLPTTLTVLSPRSPLVQVGDANPGVLGLLLETEQLVRIVESASVEAVQEIGTAAALGGIPGSPFVVVGSSGAVAGGNRWTYSLSAEAEIGQAAFGRDRSGLVGVVPVLDEGAVLVLLADGSVERIDVAARVGGSGALNTFPVLADFDGDGRLDVLTSYSETLVAFTQGGAIVSGFPIALPAATVAQPLVAELSDSGGWSVVVASLDGYLYAYDVGRRGAPVPGFPLAVGRTVQATPLLQNKELYAISEEGTLKAWTLDNLGEIWWGQLYANAQNQSYVELTADPAPPPATQSLLVDAETYNWPNPIRAGQTNLRCMTTTDATVRITVLDGAGRLVDEMEMALRGGVPAEHSWQTEAASGVYYARITAVAADGREETKLVKMAVIR